MVCILEYYKYPACMANIVNIMNIMYVSIHVRNSCCQSLSFKGAHVEIEKNILNKKKSKSKEKKKMCS